jgi:hypothetical protein
MAEGVLFSRSRSIRTKPENGSVAACRCGKNTKNWLGKINVVIVVVCRIVAESMVSFF